MDDVALAQKSLVSSASSPLEKHRTAEFEFRLDGDIENESRKRARELREQLS